MDNFNDTIEKMRMKPGNGDICKSPYRQYAFKVDKDSKIIPEQSSDPREFDPEYFLGIEWYIIPAKKEMLSHEKIAEKEMNPGAEPVTSYGIRVAKLSAKNRDILYADLMEAIIELVTVGRLDMEVFGKRMQAVRAELNKINAVLNPKQQEPVRPPPNAPRQMG